MPVNSNQIGISTALRLITSSKKWSVLNDFDLNTIEWHDNQENCPSITDIEAKRQEIAEQRNSQEYIDFRVNGKYEFISQTGGTTQRVKVEEGYPSIEDQLDILYHGGIEEWRNVITKVKEQFPKK